MYGASFATGSFINSNDVMVATQYAASSTNPALDGLASADEQVTQTVDAAGRTLSVPSQIAVVFVAELAA